MINPQEFTPFRDFTCTLINAIRSPHTRTPYPIIIVSEIYLTTNTGRLHTTRRGRTTTTGAGRTTTGRGATMTAGRGAGNTGGPTRTITCCACTLPPNSKRPAIISMIRLFIMLHFWCERSGTLFQTGFHLLPVLLFEFLE